MCHYSSTLGHIPPPEVIATLSNEVWVSWAKPESLAEPSDFSYSLQMISTDKNISTVIHSATTNNTNLTLTLDDSLANSDLCTKYYITITPIANSGNGTPTNSAMFTFPQGIFVLMIIK